MPASGRRMCFDILLAQQLNWADCQVVSYWRLSGLLLMLNKHCQNTHGIAAVSVTDSQWLLIEYSFIWLPWLHHPIQFDDSDLAVIADFMHLTDVCVLLLFRILLCRPFNIIPFYRWPLAEVAVCDVHCVEHQLSEFNSMSKPSISDSGSSLQWTNVRQNKPPFLIGEEVVRVISSSVCLCSLLLDILESELQQELIDWQFVDIWHCWLVDRPKILF